MRILASLILAILIAGCVRPSAVTETASDLQRKVTPAARGIAERSQRLVRAAGRAADDAALATKVRGILISRRGLDASGISVTARRRVIRLQGTVPSLAQKQLAARIARETVGVRDVSNRLEVRNAG